MSERPAAMLKGTLDLLILRTIEIQPRHGLGVSDRIAQITGGTFVVKPGSLFPALHRLEQEGYIEGAWGESDQGRRAKVYRITAAGRKRLTTERRSWDRIVTAVGQVLDPA
ncbi:MAG: PadR family transcriptional regulator [Acidobacteria bacterium]|nr:PadR family transcriptional regulator [Acidobacteriota bacterium]